MPRRVKLILANDILSGNEFKNMRELGSDVKQDLFIFLCVCIYGFGLPLGSPMKCDNFQRIPQDRVCVYVCICCAYLLCVQQRPSAI